MLSERRQGGYKGRSRHAAAEEAGRAAAAAPVLFICSFPGCRKECGEKWYLEQHYIAKHVCNFGGVVETCASFQDCNHCLSRTASNVADHGDRRRSWLQHFNDKKHWTERRSFQQSTSNLSPVDDLIQQYSSTAQYSTANNDNAIYAGKDNISGKDEYWCRWCSSLSHQAAGNSSKNVTDFQRNRKFTSKLNVERHCRLVHKNIPQLLQVAPEEEAAVEDRLPHDDVNNEQGVEDYHHLAAGGDPEFNFVPKLVAENDNDHAIYGKKITEFIEQVYGKGCFAAKTLDDFIGFCRKVKRNSTEELKIELLELDALVKVRFLRMINICSSILLFIRLLAPSSCLIIRLMRESTIVNDHRALEV